MGGVTGKMTGAGMELEGGAGIGVGARVTGTEKSGS